MHEHSENFNTEIENIKTPNSGKEYNNNFKENFQ